MSNDVKLEPCPFPKCRGSAELLGGGGAGYWISCSTCGASTGQFATMFAVVGFWNGRATRERDTLAAAAQQFRFYEQQHLAKSPPDTAKATTNREWAERCERTVATPAASLAPSRTEGDEPGTVLLAVQWEWIEGKHKGGRFWGCHARTNDGRIRDWPGWGLRAIGAATVTVVEGRGLELLPSEAIKGPQVAVKAEPVDG